MSSIGALLIDKKTNDKYGFSIIKIHNETTIEILYLDYNDNRFNQDEISLLSVDFEIVIPDKYKELIKIYFDRGFNLCDSNSSQVDINIFKRVALKELNNLKKQIFDHIKKNN